MTSKEKPVGLTADAGFQIGVRRTLPITQEQAWKFISSSDGLQLWLGGVSALSLNKGETFLTKEGTSGELRVVKPHEQLRLTWRKAGWAQSSTLQIRLISSSPAKTTISFHQEKLDSAAVREEMKARWEQAIEAISKNFID